MNEQQARVTLLAYKILEDARLTEDKALALDWWTIPIHGYTDAECHSASDIIERLMDALVNHHYEWTPDNILTIGALAIDMGEGE